MSHDSFWEPVASKPVDPNAFLTAKKAEIDDHMEQCMRIVDIDQYGTERQRLEMHATLEASDAVRKCNRSIDVAVFEFSQAVNHILSRSAALVGELEREATKV